MVASSPSFEIRHPDRFFIGGDWVAPSSSASLDVIVASTEQVFVRVAEAQEADVNRAVTAAREAFDSGPWPFMSHAERAGYMNALADGLIARAADLGLIWTSESGIIHSLAAPYAGGMTYILRYYASLADSFVFEERHTPTNGGNVGLLVREPVGVVAAIIPWNAPLQLMLAKVAPALIAGCTVVVKASPEAPSSAYVLAEVAEAVGLPKGVINILTADRAVSEKLVRHPGIDKVSFTGSSAAGKQIASICGERIARCTLELGGKSPGIVLDDYDLDAMAESLVGTAPLLTGQACSSLTRIIVSKHRHDDLVDALSSRFAAIKVADPFDQTSQMGPLAMKRQRERVEHYIGKGREEGATLATGGGRPKHLDRGYYIEPTIFGNVSNDMTIAREEIFGPVISVIPADSEEQAIDIANDTVFGLNASVFTNDADKAYKIARRLRSGTVGHNSFRSDPGIAFGGFKQSGLGREGGVEGLHPFLETKTIILDAEPAHLSG